MVYSKVMILSPQNILIEYYYYYDVFCILCERYTTLYQTVKIHFRNLGKKIIIIAYATHLVCSACNLFSFLLIKVARVTV